MFHGVHVGINISRRTSLSSIVRIVRLVVHDQSVVHKIEAVRASLVRALHHLTDWKINTTCTSDTQK